MKDNFLKKTVKGIFFREGSIRTIFWGPLRGCRYRVSCHSGLSALYSGNERIHQKCFSRLINPGDTVIDVGANWGVHTLLMSKLVGPSGRVIAIEPDPNAVSDLRFNQRLNGCENITVNQVAAADSEGEIALYLAKSSSLNTIESDRQQAGLSEKLMVKVTRLDSIVEDLKLGNLCLIKIDVEGAESQVLQGAESILRNQRPYFVIDLHTPEQDLSVAGILIAHRYRLQRPEGPPILRTDLSWPHREGVWGSILASPVEKG